MQLAHASSQFSAEKGYWIMILRLQTFVCVSALTLVALGCKTESIPSKGPNAYATNQGPAVVTQGAGESGVDSESSAPLPAASVETHADKFDTSTVESPASKARHAAKLEDAQIAAITDAANSAEIEQGRLARDKAKDPRVRDFAAMMVDHHSDAKQEQLKLKLEPVASADSERMVGEAADALKSLKQKRGKDFDRAYLQLQIDEHRKLLGALSDQLLPAAKNGKLEGYLENLEPQVQSHLAQAERLQAELNGTSSPSDKEGAAPRPASPRVSKR